jgi:hypothetical protein
VGKGWPQLKTWALEWLRRIRELYRLNRRRLAAKPDSAVNDLEKRASFDRLERATRTVVGPGVSF